MVSLPLERGPFNRQYTGGLPQKSPAYDSKYRRFPFEVSVTIKSQSLRQKPVFNWRNAMRHPALVVTKQGQ